MAIQELEIHGYRSFEHVTWKPGRLNLLVGPNGSGKSNLLRLLDFISNTARGNLLQQINQAGGMVPLLWNQEAAELGWKLRIDPLYVSQDLAEDAVTFEFDVARFHLGSGYYISEEKLSMPAEFKPRRGPEPTWVYTCDPVNGASLYDEVKREHVPFHDFDENQALISQIARSGAHAIPALAKGRLDEWRVHHDVEVGPHSTMRLPVVTQPSMRVDPDGANLAAVLHTLYTGNREFKQEIDDGMKAAFADEYVEVVFQPAAAQTIQLAVQWRSSKQPHAGMQLSDGTLRFLFLLTVLATPEPPTVIAIDEPEVGLHPTMLPIVAEYAAAAAERTQVVISSHSPEFLDGFTEYQPDVTVFHWEDGRTRLFQLPPDRLASWLQKYRLGRMFTSGELDLLTDPKVDVPDDIEQRLRDLPPESLPPPPGPASPEDATHE